MNSDEQRAYRQLGLDRLEQLLMQLPERAFAADFFVDSSIRALSNLPTRPDGALPYEGLYGAGKAFDDYRDIATDRLEELLISLSGFKDIDEGVDQQIRLLSNLPPKAAGVAPYVRLFNLRSAAPDPDDRALQSLDIESNEEFVTTDMLLQIVGSNELVSRIKMMTPGMNATLKRYQINSKLRIAHFLAQVIHESGGFRWLRELWGPTEAQEWYEGRRDLGNNHPGDGFRFRGRGIIQLTGRANYQKFFDELGVDVVSKPELVENFPHAVLAAGWFWKGKSINDPADQDNVREVTRRVNGGFNGLAERIAILERAKLVLS
ncbi:glycoside hydrolase family 19 protein [Leptolyngbya sp. FACHB-321]|uniref:glycoside hydrolase family 19 protein n=1 Tax=Leptolyngbya sp. FACHB-321 TaxID=2692807 RepID=UPI001685BE9D|nr:glycoside hydrolase family 19 protein [Leptolyngbya sp. FACHB-321]MBD2033768.1 glycoside hydrolase family 19 protein [Leptolyngbya sp. FACHB-321]